MQADILIIGGGPAGLSSALHLVQLAPELAPRILVLEKAHYPRPKLCGGALLPDAEAILTRLGLDVTEVPHVDAREAHLDFAGKGLVVSLPGGHTLRLVRRDEFDSWLAGKVQQAGVQIHEGVTVRNVTARPDRLIVETNVGDFEPLLAIAADGSNSVTRRCLLPEAAVRTARLLEVVAPAQSADGGRPQAADASLHQADVAYFDFRPVPLGIAGYTWDFPTQIKGRPMRCWGIYDTNLLARAPRPALKDPLADEMRRRGYDLSACELQGHPIRWFDASNKFSIPRLLFVGDAAGVDGIFGEGISFALGYGQIAAEEVCAALTSNDFSFRHYRRRLLRSPMGRALRTRSRITHILYRLRWAWFQKFFWRLAKPIVAALAFAIVLNWAKRME